MKTILIVVTLVLVIDFGLSKLSWHLGRYSGNTVSLVGYAYNLTKELKTLIK